MPSTALPVLGDGTLQHSSIHQTKLTFDGPVTLEAGAFTLIRRGADGGTVPLNVTSTSVVNNQTVMTFEFSGAFVRPTGALVDGYYQLTIDGSKIRRGTQMLDVNQNGVVGQTLVIGDDEADNFFALYSDTNGDGLVDVAEFGQFRSAFGKAPTDPGYLPYFDFDGGGIGVSDFGQFRSRFGKSKIAWN